MSGDIFERHDWVGYVIPASSGQRPGMPLKAYNAQNSLTRENHAAQNASSAEVEKPHVRIVHTSVPKCGTTGTLKILHLND